MDALSTYKQPAFVYIVPNGELRGGAWVVLDPSINQNGMMEMYADNTSRAGVLEPEGIVEIKFRKERMLAMMDRLDPKYHELKAKAAAEGASAQTSALTEELAVREKQLWSTYSQMAVQFADLHDTPVRMKAKGTIREIVTWAQSRRYFYWRLRLRLKEEEILSRFIAAEPALSRPAAVALLRGVQQQPRATDRESVEQWLELESAVQTQVQDLQTKHAAASLSAMAPLSGVGLGQQLHGLSAEEAAVRFPVLIQGTIIEQV